MPDDTCPHCGHEWRRHDPEDGRCDAHSAEQGVFGPCRCGRDVAFTAAANARLSRAALDCVRDARGDDEAALGSMWTIMQAQFERGRIPECHGPTRDDARKMLAGFRRVAARDARDDDEAGRTCPTCGPNYIWPDTPEHCSNCGGPIVEAARSPQDEDHEVDVGRIVRFLVDAGCEPAAEMVEIEFGRPPSE